MEQIKSIFYKEIAYPYSNNQYGLAIIIMMQKKCLYFDSSSFYFVKSYERVFVTDYQQYKKIKVQKSILYEMR